MTIIPILIGNILIKTPSKRQRAKDATLTDTNKIAMETKKAKTDPGPMHNCTKDTMASGSQDSTPVEPRIQPEKRSSEKNLGKLDSREGRQIGNEDPWFRDVDLGLSDRGHSHRPGRRVWRPHCACELIVQDAATLKSLRSRY